ncbi:MAG: DNA repair protein RecN [Shewanella sp.]
MLCQLSINNFAIVRFLELDFKFGMTSITGETGAGKSIAIDALGLCLGNRADSSTVRPGANKAEVSARFSLSDIPIAKRWLEDNDLDNDNDCILRRTVSSDGRSRAYINGNPVPLSQAKNLGQLLISIHGQHAHHAMLKSEHQLTLLDSYANHKMILNSVLASYQRCKLIEKKFKTLTQSQHARISRKQLIQYQVEELDELSLSSGEFEEIEAEHKKLANGTALVEACKNELFILQENDQGSVESLINAGITQAQELETYDPLLSNVVNMLNEALIQVQESSSELENYLAGLELDPEHLTYLEKRLSQSMLLARKHHVSPNELADHHLTLKAELHLLDYDEEALDDLKQQVATNREDYLLQAKKLSQSRHRYAKELDKQVTKSIHELSMPKGKFTISVVFDETLRSPNGCDTIEFLVSTNPGQPLQPLSKVASGGELSRIGLGIQVITAKKVSTPTLIFDEVDVGISGATAAVVGRMLRKLGDSTQVLCVTHLPQVAGNGHQHMFVDKKSKAGKTETSMMPLDRDQRIEELARLLGGDEITNNTLANAKELLRA